jgi:uncharacterized membrane protein
MKIKLKVLAALLSTIGVLILIYGLLSHNPTMSVPGAGGEEFSYPLSSIIYIVIGSLMLGSGLTLFISEEGDVSLPIITKVKKGESQVLNKDAPVESPNKNSLLDNSADNQEQADIFIEMKAGKPTSFESNIVLRLLTGDERTLYRTLMDAGGEAYQKDLVIRTKMSDAKTSRVIDRLEEKGLVSKERHGMTNMIRIKVHDQNGLS